MFSFTRRDAAHQLQGRIHGYWQLKNDRQIQFLNLVPDGFFELFLVLGGKVLVKHPDQEHYTTFPPAGIIGQSRRLFSLILSPGAHLLCVKWYPWAPKSFLCHPVHFFTHQIMDFESVVSEVPFRQLIRDLRSTACFRMQTMLLDRFFTRYSWQMDQYAPFLEFAVQRLFAHSGAIRIESLGNTVSASNRYIQKLFKEQVGLSPKQYARVIRVKKASLLIEENPSNGQFSQIAAELGYFDQSHFLKDFKGIIGLSPTAYVEQQGLHDMSGQQDYLSQWDYA